MMPDKSIDDFENLSRGRTSLVQGEPIQSLESRLDVILSAKLFDEFLCVAWVKCHTIKDELTKPSLTDLLGCKSEGREQFYYYLY